MANTVKRAPKTVGEARAAALAHPLVAAILAADDRPYKDLQIPEWPDPADPDGGGVWVRIRGASAAVVDAHDASMFALRGDGEGMTAELTKNYRARFVIGCLFDLDDEPIPLTAEQLGAKSGRVVNRLFAVAQRLSGSNERATEDAGKDSETGQSESSTTD